MTTSSAIEIVTTWGDEVLDVVYVPASRSRQWAFGAVHTNSLVHHVRAVPPAEPIADVVEDCLVTSVKRWSFPAHMGGVVAVAYPFVFEPAP